MDTNLIYGLWWGCAWIYAMWIFFGNLENLSFAEVFCCTLTSVVHTGLTFGIGFVIITHWASSGL